MPVLKLAERSVLSASAGQFGRIVQQLLKVLGVTGVTMFCCVIAAIY